MFLRVLSDFIILRNFGKCDIYILTKITYYTYISTILPSFSRNILSLNISDCDYNFTASNGQISSPNFPSYPTSRDVFCRYRIMAPNGKRIHLYFPPNQLINDTSGCYYGSLRLYEGRAPDLRIDTPRAQYCKSRMTCHKSFLSNGNSLLLVYASGSHYNFFRFMLRYKFTSGKMF